MDKDAEQQNQDKKKSYKQKAINFDAEPRKLYYEKKFKVAEDLDQLSEHSQSSIQNS